MNDRQEFISLVKTNIKRQGIDALLATLENTDFYTAPASTRFHDSVEGGLCHHSIRVFDYLTENGITESKAIVSLFHDLCKIGYYVVDYRNTKNETGQWVKIPYYTVDDKYPFGHSPKSIDLLRDFITLTEEEKLAIRWHMGGFEPKEEYQYLSKAFSTCKLAVDLHIADLKATYYGE